MDSKRENIDIGGYKALQNISLKGDDEDLKLQLNSSSVVQEQLKKITHNVIESIKAANDIRPWIKSLKNIDVTVVEAASLSMQNNEAKMHDPTYILAEKLSVSGKVEKFYLRTIYKSVKKAYPSFPKNDTRTLTILFGLREVKDINPIPTITPIDAASKDKFVPSIKEEIAKAEQSVQLLLTQVVENNSFQAMLDLQYAQSILTLKRYFAEKVISGDLKDNPVWDSEKARQALMNILQSSDIIPSDILQFQATLNEVRAEMALQLL